MLVNAIAPARSSLLRLTARCPLLPPSTPTPPRQANAINQALFEDKQGQLEAEVERLRCAAPLPSRAQDLTGSWLLPCLHWRGFLPLAALSRPQPAECCLVCGASAPHPLRSQPIDFECGGDEFLRSLFPTCSPPLFPLTAPTVQPAD